jgi:hypothetical protein
MDEMGRQQKSKKREKERETQISARAHPDGTIVEYYWDFGD